MKKIIYGALIGITAIAVILNYGAYTKGAPILTYVYSGSMEPLIKVNDAFFIWPAAEYKTGDIIMYRPAVLNAPYITHRIIGSGSDGFITKGDNSPFADQESKEPYVTADRIIGKVVTLNGQPLIIPGLGRLISKLRTGAGNYAGYASVILLAAGVITAFTGGKRRIRRHKPRHRYRLSHLYRIISMVAACSVVLSIYQGSRVTKLQYLVSEYPGSVGSQIAVNKQDSLTMKVSNNGLFPVWTVITGINPLKVRKAPATIWPRSAEEVILDVLPRHKTGVYQGYVRISAYPVLLPRTWLLYLHGINPFWAMLADGLSMGLYFCSFFKLLEHIHGFEGFIPLRAVRDKILERRLRRAGLKINGKSRGSKL